MSMSLRDNARRRSIGAADGCNAKPSASPASPGTRQNQARGSRRASIDATGAPPSLYLQPTFRLAGPLLRDKSSAICPTTKVRDGIGSG